jgi:16S rRNA (adenine1518-N6/adenine1519-N6)-dimethyltransferase
MKQHTRTLGQVFLHDANIVRKIVRYAHVDPMCNVTEIGCGRGILTRELSNAGHAVNVVEIDQRWLDYVKSLTLKNVYFHHADVLTVDFSKWQKSAVIANIPYRITSPLLGHFSKYKHQFYSVTIMVQKELALRLMAKNNSQNYGAITLFCQYHFNVVSGFDVARSCFFPVPKVDSYVLQLQPKPSVFLAPDEHLFFLMVRSFFWGRRKTMLNGVLNGPYLVCDQQIKENYFLTQILKNRVETMSLIELQQLFHNIKPYITPAKKVSPLTGTKE